MQKRNDDMPELRKNDLLFRMKDLKNKSRLTTLKFEKDMLSLQESRIDFDKLYRDVMGESDPIERSHLKAKLLQLIQLKKIILQKRSDILKIQKEIDPENYDIYEQTNIDIEMQRLNSIEDHLKPQLKYFI